MKKKLIDIEQYEEDSPERILAKFLFFWQTKCYGKMLDYCQKSWLLSYSKSSKLIPEKYFPSLRTPTEWIRSILGQKDIISVEIESTAARTSCFIEAVLNINYKLKKTKINTKIKCNIIKENESGHCTEDGAWGVNPVSCLNEFT